MLQTQPEGTSEPLENEGQATADIIMMAVSSSIIVIIVSSMMIIIMNIVGSEGIVGIVCWLLWLFATKVMIMIMVAISYKTVASMSGSLPVHEVV